MSYSHFSIVITVSRVNGDGCIGQYMGRVWSGRKKENFAKAKDNALESFINTNVNVTLPKLFKKIATSLSLKKNALPCTSYQKDEFEFDLNTFALLSCHISTLNISFTHQETVNGQNKYKVCVLNPLKEF